MINLKKYPLGEIRKGSGKNLFVVRIEKNLPIKMSGICEEIPLKKTRKVKVSSMSTEQRTLGYVLRFVGKPRIFHKWNYLYLFYGRKISTRVKIEHQDGNIRLTKSGNENFVGLVLRSKAREPQIDDEGEDD